MRLEDPAETGGPVTVPLKTRILLADDHEVVREGLRMVLDSAPDLEVVAEAGDGAEAVELALAEDVDLAVLDVSMPRMTGLQAARELSQRKPELRVLMLSMHDNEQYFFEALKAGASGYVLKTRGQPRPDRGVPGDDARRAVPLPGCGTRAGAGLPRARRARRDDSRGPAQPARARGGQADRRGPHQRGDRASSCSSARRRSIVTAPTCWRSSACATALSSPVTRSAGGLWSP